ncbi:hypothetical protein BM1_06464 [Bipolaris maydis]|nr:hypothetical protein BM1_06464 [Bipolaris maydis]
MQIKAGAATRCHGRDSLQKQTVYLSRDCGGEAGYRIPAKALYPNRVSASLLDDTIVVVKESFEELKGNEDDLSFSYAAICWAMADRLEEVQKL